MPKHTHSDFICIENLEITLPSRAGNVHILRGLDLKVKKGDVVGITGPSGSGKSTLLMVLAGLEAVKNGRVTIANCDYGAMDEDALARFRRAHIGIVFQSFHLIPTMTALENVALPLELAGKRDAFGSAKSLLDEVGLGKRLTHYPAQLSGGEQQRTALARALVAKPAVILADEPTGNLDQSTGKQVIDLLFSLVASRAMTLFLVTHDPMLAKRCNRVIEMRDGQITADTHK